MLKKCSLELGGKNAIVVLDDADVEACRRRRAVRAHSAPLVSAAPHRRD